MRKHATERKDDLAQNYPMTRITPIAAAVSALLLPIAGHAEDAASSAPAEPTQTVVVTGIRGSIESSIATKRNSDSIVEAVTAEDIGKLPDVSIAESLARLPGVAAQRVDGRAQDLSIRGMGPKFGVTLLNGREMVSTGDDRSFEYDQFPSELVSKVVVYKTPDAALGTQGLAGTVNIMTLSPLDYHERKINLNARAERNSFGELISGNDGKGNRLSASYVDQFANNTIGVALGYAHLDSPNQKKYFNPWDLGVNGAFDTVNGVPAGQYAVNGFETGIASTKTVRNGLLGVIEYKPNSNFRSKLDLFDSKFEQRMNGRELIGVLGAWGAAYDATVTPLTNGDFGGTLTNAVPLITQRKDDRDDSVKAIGWNSEWKLDKWTATADLSYSRAKRHEWIGEAYALSASPMTYTVDIPAGYSKFGTISSNFNFADPNNFQLATAWWGPSGGAASAADVDDDMKSLRLSGRRELDWGAIESFDGGLLYSERKKNINVATTSYNLIGGSPCYTDFSCRAIPAGIVQSPANLGFVGVPAMLSFDVGSAFNSGAYVADSSSSLSPTWNWGVKEKVTTVFGKLGVNYDAKVPIRGGIGLQIVNAKQSSSGLYDDQNGNLTNESGGKTYTDVLPSLNLAGELATNTYLRLGAARVVARPNMADMRASTTASVDTTTQMWSGSGGNPELQPWRANAYDLSLERYIGKRSYFAAAVFYKKVTTAILTKDVIYDFSKFTNPTAIQPLSPYGTMTTPVNTDGGQIHGWELSGALEGGLLDKALDGFGVQANYCRTASDLSGTDINGAPTSTSLDGLSGDTWDLAAYYEKNGFEARFAQRYRSDFTASRHNAFKPTVESIRGEKITDVQIGYEMQTGPYKGLGVLFQINNLTNTPYVVTQSAAGLTALKEYHEFGRQYLLGLSYKL